MPLANAKPRALAGLTVLLFLLLATSASAAVRFAGPGATGKAPCTDRQAPCSIAVAVGTNAPDTEDEVILLPGEYSDAAGDLGATGTVELPSGVRLHGEAGQPPPLIRLTSSRKAFLINISAEISRLSIRSNVKFGGAFLMINDGVVANVVASSSGASATTCEVLDGLVRDTACLASGSDSAALGDTRSGAGQVSPELNNVTANATGTGSLGIAYGGSNGTNYRVSGAAVIASGAIRDILAVGGVNVELRSSNYSNVLAQNTAQISPAALVDEALFAPDGYHQLPSSPTVDRGSLGFRFGNDDVDGQRREIGASVDIGADELADPTTVEVSCDPQPVLFPGGTGSCVGTTADVLPNAPPMVGTLVFTLLPKPPFSAADVGTLSNGGRCTLSTIEPITKAQCGVTFTPGKAGPGTYAIAVSYAGDRIHDGNQSSSQLTVVGAPGGGGGPGGGNGGGGGPPVAGPQPAPATKLTGKPKKKSTRTLATFRFSADQPGSSFECKFDRKPFRKCRSPFKQRTKPGTHTFRVRAVNGTVADPTPARFRWRVLAD